MRTQMIKIEFVVAKTTNQQKQKIYNKTITMNSNLICLCILKFVRKIYHNIQLKLKRFNPILTHWKNFKPTETFYFKVIEILAPKREWRMNAIY